MLADNGDVLIAGDCFIRMFQERSDAAYPEDASVVRSYAHLSVISGSASYFYDDRSPLKAAKNLSRSVLFLRIPDSCMHDAERKSVGIINVSNIGIA